MFTEIRKHVIYVDDAIKVCVYKVDGCLREVTVVLGDSDKVSLPDKESVRTLYHMLETVMEREFD